MDIIKEIVQRIKVRDKDKGDQMSGVIIVKDSDILQEIVMKTEETDKDKDKVTDKITITIMLSVTIATNSVISPEIVMKLSRHKLSVIIVGKRDILQETALKSDTTTESDMFWF